MMAEAQMFWDSIVGKIKSLIKLETTNALRAERYEVTTAPNGTVIGVTKALGSKEIFLPYSQEVSSAIPGQPVLVVWWGSMSNAKVYYYASGYNGGGGGGGGGQDGATFIPSVSVGGIISWTNNGGLPNPTPRNIMGPTGDSGVYVGETTPTDPNVNVWVDPTGEQMLDGIIDYIYPVGSVYISVNSVSPSTLFGGTWEQIEDTFLLAAGQTYTAGSTGGEADHTLTVDELPAHSHRQKVTAGVGDDGSVRRRDYGSDGVGSSYDQGCTTYDTGGGGAHNNMPPYLAVYVWKRTA